MATPSPDKIFARLYQLNPDSEALYDWDTHRAVYGKNGPLSEEKGDDGLPLTNQCVAVDVYSIEKTGGIQKMGASFAKIRNFPNAIISMISTKSSTSRASTVKFKSTQN